MQRQTWQNDKGGGLEGGGSKGLRGADVAQYDPHTTRGDYGKVPGG